MAYLDDGTEVARPRRSRTWLAVGIVVLLVGAAAGAYAVYRVNDTSSRITLTIEGDGVDERVTVADDATVADALLAAGIRPHEGKLLSAKDGRVLDPKANAATYTLGGSPVAATSPLVAGATLTVTDGKDEVEATRNIDKVLPAPELHQVLIHVYEAGVPGLERQVVGVRSGEVVSNEVVRLPIAPQVTKRRAVALTFDDGPTPEWTPQFLDLLKAKGVKATFCMVGKNVTAYPDIVKRVKAEGHELCNHTLNHDTGMKGAPRERVEDQIGGAVRAFTSIGVGEPLYYRPPGGILDDQIKQVAWGYHEEVLYWKVDTKDWQTGATAFTVMANVDKEVGDGGIILMHDGGGKSRALSLQMAGIIIDHLKAQGFEFTFPVIPAPASATDDGTTTSTAPAA
jgi:peptidoglycan/xylan/chitin deacetylase (PgdA/CDA1 family)